MKLSTILGIVVMGTSLMSPTTEAKDWLSTDGLVPQVRGVDQSSLPTYLDQARADSVAYIQYFPIDADAPIDRLSAAKSEIAGYSALESDWDGDGGIVPSTVHIRDSLAFLTALPGGFPIPTAMLSSNGTIGLYWDVDHAYADISFEGETEFSLFSKNRLTKVERFTPSVRVADLDAKWFEENLGLLRNV